MKKTVIVIESSTCQDYQKYIRKREPLLINPRATTLIISIYHIENDTETSMKSLIVQFKENLDYVKNLSPRRARPNCLFLLDVKKKLNNNIVNDMLQLAWSRKFLDLTIIQFPITNKSIDTQNSILHSYNPFLSTFTSLNYPTNTRIFPNKLSNMNNYTLTIAVVRRPPLINFERDTHGTPINLNGSQYGFISALSNKLNFHIKWLSPDVIAFVEPIPGIKPSTSLLDLITRGDADFGANHVFLHLAFMGRQRQGERSIMTFVDEFCALVPVYRLPSWLINTSVIGVLLWVLFHVAATCVLARLLRLDSRFWRPERVLRVLLGSAVPQLPASRSAERLFSLGLLVLSLCYSSIVYAKLADVSLMTRDLGPFHTFDDIRHHGLTLEVHPYDAPMTFKDEFADLKRQSKLVPDPLNCPNRLLANRNIGCLIDKSIARVIVLAEHCPLQPRLRIVKPSFWSAPQGCVFSEASPYVNEFSRIMERIVESGLYKRWAVHNERKGSMSIYQAIDEWKQPDKFITNKLIVIWLAGTGLACLAFFSEIIAFYFNRITG